MWGVRQMLFSSVSKRFCHKAADFIDGLTGFRKNVGENLPNVRNLGPDLKFDPSSRSAHFFSNAYRVIAEHFRS